VTRSIAQGTPLCPGPSVLVQSQRRQRFFIVMMRFDEVDRKNE
jgi:hypothetical protein